MLSSENTIPQSLDSYQENLNGNGSPLGDVYPQIDLPHRVDAPECAHSRKKQNLVQQSMNSVVKTKSLKFTKETTFKALNENQHLNQTKIKDLSMLAYSSKRSGKLQMECTSHFSSGVLYDNMMDYPKALDCYKKFANACIKMGDQGMESLAYNCIGVDYQNRATLGSEIPYTGGFQSPDNPYLSKSIEYHLKHLELADTAGKFVAHTNIGLAQGSLGNHVEAARHHQDALRLAIELQSTYGQSIAVGNLGLLARRQGDFASARACMDQYLQLVQSLRDYSAEINAWTQLGMLTMYDKNYDQAARFFHQGKQIAQETREMGTLKQICCYIGIAEGSGHLDEYMEGLSKKGI